MILSGRITSFLLGMLIAGVIILLIRKDRLHTKYAVLWLLMALASLVFGAFPRLIDRIAGMLGIFYPPILFVIVAMGLIFIKILTMDIDRSKQEQWLRLLTERLAVLEGEKYTASKPKDKRGFSDDL